MITIATIKIILLTCTINGKIDAKCYKAMEDCNYEVYAQTLSNITASQLSSCIKRTLD